MENLEKVTKKVGARLTELSEQQPTEGELTKKVEHIGAQIPSMGWLAIAMGSMALSIGLATYSEKKWLANFVGHWVPTFLMFGLYNKIVKQHGSDQASNKILH